MSKFYFSNISGGIVLTASHNPGGPENDFGIKFNCENGGPAPDQFTNKIYQLSTTISEYKIVDGLNIDISKIGVHKFEVIIVIFVDFMASFFKKKLFFQINDSPYVVEIIDSVQDYVSLMKDIFCFEKLRKFVSEKPLKMRIDSMNGGTQ